MTQAFNLAQLANNVNSSGQLNAATALNGLVQPANGGTGLSTVGTSGNVLTSNGTNWVSAASPVYGFSNVSIFTAGTTWTIPSGVTKVIVGVWAGGGGGYSSVGGSPTNGGNGGIGVGLITGLTSGGTVTIIVGSGGNGGNGGNSGTPTAGGASSFGSYVSCTGGATGLTGTNGIATFAGSGTQQLGKSVSTFGGIYPVSYIAANGIYGGLPGSPGGGGGGGGAGFASGGNGGSSGVAGVQSLGPGGAGSTNSGQTGGSGGGVNGGVGGTANFGIDGCGGGGGGAIVIWY
jgi:hypothetical protein